MQYAERLHLWMLEHLARMQHRCPGDACGVEARAPLSEWQLRNHGADPLGHFGRGRMPLGDGAQVLAVSKPGQADGLAEGPELGVLPGGDAHETAVGTAVEVLPALPVLAGRVAGINEPGEAERQAGRQDRDL